MSEFEPTTNRATQALTGIILVCPSVMEHVTLEAWECQLGRQIPDWVDRSKLSESQTMWFVRMPQGKAVILSSDAFSTLFYEMDTGVYE